MKRALLIIAVGLFVALAAFCAVFYSGTASHREMIAIPAPELGWLKKEFNLGQGEFERISRLHAAYQPHCREMCRRIDEQNEKVRALVAKATGVTPEIEKALAESARLRMECQTIMLKHFFEVSQQMPAEQGRRYLDWVQERTFLSNYGMTQQQ
jgi:hypothetical protein